MYSVSRPGPPNAQDVTRDTGTDMASNIRPLEGSKRHTCPPSHMATHSFPSASIAIPSGIPSSAGTSTTTRSFVMSPESAS